MNRNGTLGEMKHELSVELVDKNVDDLKLIVFDQISKADTKLQLVRRLAVLVSLFSALEPDAQIEIKLGVELESPEINNLILNSNINMLKKIEQDELIPMLKSAGIEAKEYSNPRAVGTPIEFFITTVPGGTGILIKKGEKIGLKIAVDKKHKQAVLSVHEGKRKIIRNVKFQRMVLHDKVTSQQLIKKAKRAFNMQIPRATIAVSNVKEGKLCKDRYQRVARRYTATVTATVTKARSNHFLIGKDETSCFISILPKAPTSVEDAHRMLRPKGVPANAKRQGEFFFVSTTKKFPKEEIRQSVMLEKGSKHRAQFAIPKGNPVRVGWRSDAKKVYQAAEYVKGLIFDKRAYRHAPLNLGSVWHKVVRNNEVHVKNQPSRRVRYD